MGIVPHPREENRQKAVAEITRAHELVLREWPDDRIKRLSDIVEQDPLYRPLDPSEVEREFRSEVASKRSEVELEPVTFKPARYAEEIIVGWEAAGDD